MTKTAPIGKVAAIESCPTTITSFTFWTNADLKLSPFDIIKVRHLDNSFTFGQVEEINHITPKKDLRRFN